MAGDWLKLEAKTPEKAEVLAITARMGWEDPDLTVGKLFRVWRWFDQQTIDGNAPGVTMSLLDRIAGVTGFAAAMASERWLIVSDDGICLPNFHYHCGTTAKERAQTAKRVANFKSNAKGNVGSVTRALPREEKRREEKRREELCTTKETGGFPPRPDGRRRKPPDSSQVDQTSLAMDAYNRILARPHGALPKATKIGLELKREWVKKCSDIVRQLCQTLYGNPRVIPDFWTEYFTSVKADPFRSGLTQSGPGHENWKPDFEYLLKRKTMMKVFELSGADDEQD